MQLSSGANRQNNYCIRKLLFWTDAYAVRAVKE